MNKAKLALAVKAIASKTITLLPDDSANRIFIAGEREDGIVVYTATEGSIPVGFSMSADMMATINGAISADDIEMSVDGQRLTVSGGTESVDLAISTENLCSPEKKPDVPGTALNPQAVSAAFKSLSLACSKKDNRESIRYSRWQGTSTKVIVTTFDGYSVARTSIDATGIDGVFYVPVSALALIAGAMPKKGGECSVWVNENSLYVLISNMVAIVVPIKRDVEYPDVDKLVDATYPNSITVSSQELKAMVKRMPFIKKTKENTNIVFDIGSSNNIAYRVAASDSVLKGELATLGVSSTAMKIKMAGKLWSDIVAALNGDVTITFDRPQGIMVFSCESGTFATRSA